MKDEEKLKSQALEYHQQGRPGKIEIYSTKPTLTAEDLSLAYSPGVAWPCLEIAKDPQAAYKYTIKGNLVAVISNGSAVLGLGNIGPLAGKPVMEGKGILFKRFADIDVFDIEINESTVEGFVRTVSALEPTFGGINLEDIKAPECFEIEKQLKEKLNIPVFHDDQHGTAIIAASGFLNALELSKRKIEKTKVVFCGAGAAAISCARLFVQLGLKKENLIMCDSIGVIYKGRKERMNKYKEEFTIDTSLRTLEDALKKADAFMGLSTRGMLTEPMVASMAKDPLIFAMANPEPEMYPDQIRKIRQDAYIATGRSDFPNQINNVLGFPFIFRGALDTRANKINEEMKMAAVKALAQLAKEQVPYEVQVAYTGDNFSFGRDYFIPKPFDVRVLSRIAPAVAKAAMKSGVAQNNIEDFGAYTTYLENRLSTAAIFMRNIHNRLSVCRKNQGKKIRLVFAEGSNTRILQAAQALKDGDIIHPILLGDPKIIQRKIKEMELSSLSDAEIIECSSHPKFLDFAQEYTALRKRNGITIYHAKEHMEYGNLFGTMMVKNKLADVLISGPTLNYSKCLLPIINVIKTKDKHRASGVYILVFKNRVLFFSDCTVQINPSSEDLADIAANTTLLYKKIMKKDPRIAFLSFSNFGSNSSQQVLKVKRAVQILKEKHPEINADGEVQADVAVNKGILDKLFSFNVLEGATDILIFPELNSANISYKLIQQLADSYAIGPILIPMKSVVNIVQRTANVTEIVNMCHLTSLLHYE